MQDSKQKKERVMKCFHCGNETKMSCEGTYSWGTNDVEGEDFSFEYISEMYACPVCHKVTLVERYGDETMVYQDVFGTMRCYMDEKVLYPANSIESKAIPDKIKKSYEAALKIRGIDSYTAMMAFRRTLELIVKDKGATKWGLGKRIEELADKGILPDTLKEVSSLAKLFGDSAAHDKELEFTQSDLDNIAEFVAFIIQYLYIIPDKLAVYKGVL